MSKSKISLYLVSVLLFMVLLPAACVFYQCKANGFTFGWPLIGKWFVFWAVGARLFAAGLKQATNPAFTAKEIFHLQGNEALVIVKELGFANISIGTMALISLFNNAWCIPAAITGGLYYGFAGFMHLAKKPASRNEAIALISDLYIFALLALYVGFSLL